MCRAVLKSLGYFLGAIGFLSVTWNKGTLVSGPKGPSLLENSVVSGFGRVMKTKS